LREKYIEERFPRYMVFGEYPDGCVDVATVNGDVAVHVSRGDSQRLIHQRDEVLDMLITLAIAFDEAAPDAFTKLWYGK